MKFRCLGDAFEMCWNNEETLVSHSFHEGNTSRTNNTVGEQVSIPNPFHLQNLQLKLLH